MNDKFFKLPLEKQRRIINAAYKVFSENSYKKAPMSEIADESGISKALLFYYFTNKKELYLYLWANAIEMTRKAVAEYKTLETDDFFEMLKRSLLSKCSLMRDYPHLYAFSLRAYYETAPRYSYQKMLSMLKPLSKAEIIQQMRIAYEYFIVENKDVEFSFPVLILVGEKDSTGKVKAYCKEWAKQAGYPLHFIKQAKHFSNGDNPEQVNTEIENFIIETVQQERENYAVL